MDIAPQQYSLGVSAGMLLRWICLHLLGKDGNWAHILNGEKPLRMVSLNIVSNVLNYCLNLSHCSHSIPGGLWSRLGHTSGKNLLWPVHTGNLWLLSPVVNLSHPWLNLHSKALDHHYKCFPYILQWTEGTWRSSTASIRWTHLVWHWHISFNLCAVEEGWQSEIAFFRALWCLGCAAKNWHTLPTPIIFLTLVSSNDLTTARLKQWEAVPLIVPAILLRLTL